MAKTTKTAQAEKVEQTIPEPQESTALPPLKLLEVVLPQAADFKAFAWSMTCALTTRNVGLRPVTKWNGGLTTHEKVVARSVELMMSPDFLSEIAPTVDLLIGSDYSHLRQPMLTAMFFAITQAMKDIATSV